MILRPVDGKGAAVEQDNNKRFASGGNRFQQMLLRSGAPDLAAGLGAQDRTIKISIAITEARFKARNGQASEAQQELDAKLAEATKAKLVGSQFEVRLASAEIKAQSDPKSAAASMRDLDHDAKASGYLLSAAKVEHLQGK